MNDQIIRMEVEKALNQDHIDVSVERGFVTLRGLVPTPADKLRAYLAAWSGPEVRGVESRIQVSNWRVKVGPS